MESSTEKSTIELQNVQVGDFVRLVRIGDSNYKESVEGEVVAVTAVSIAFKCTDGLVYWEVVLNSLYRVHTVKLYLLHRPIKRKEITKEEIFKDTPIKTVVEVNFKDDYLDTTVGTFEGAFRDKRGILIRVISLNRKHSVTARLDNVESIYFVKEAE